MSTPPAAPAANVTFDINAFIAQSIKVLVSPAEFFKTMRKTGGLVEPIIAAVIYGLIAGILTAVWTILGGAALGGVGGGMFGSVAGLSMVILMPIFAVIGLFIGAVIFLVISAIGGGSTDFETCVRAAAACMAIMPVRAALGVLVILSFYLNMLVMLLVGLYSLWIGYNALVHALGCKDQVAKIVTAIFAGLMILGTVVGLLGLMAANRAGAMISQNSAQWQKAAVEVQKAAEKAEAALKDQEKSTEQAQPSEEKPKE